MAIEANEHLVRRLFEEVYNRGNYQVIDEIIAPNYVSHNGLSWEVLGPEGIKHAATIQRTAFPDLHTTIEDLIIGGNKVVVRGKDTMTHLGDFMGYPPTGKSFSITWIDIFRVENDRLVEAWLEINIEDLRNKLSGH